MRIEPFQIGEGFGDRTETAKTLRRQLLDGDVSQEIEDGKTAVGAGIAIGGQHMVRPRAVVADRLRAPRAEEHRTRRTDLRQARTRFGTLQQQVFGGVVIGERQRSAFSRIYAYGVAAILFFHFAINISMTIGLAPVIGITLPFLSYGGSSLLSFSVLIFILLRLDADRQVLIR